MTKSPRFRVSMSEFVVDLLLDLDDHFVDLAKRFEWDGDYRVVVSAANAEEAATEARLLAASSLFMDGKVRIRDGQAVEVHKLGPDDFDDGILVCDEDWREFKAVRPASGRTVH